MSEIILPPDPLGPGEHTFYSGEGPCEAKLVVKNSLSTAPADPSVGRAYLKVSFGPPGPYQSTLAGGACADPKAPCEVKLVIELDIEREDNQQCQVGLPCPFYDFWHGAGSWNNGAPIATNEPQWFGRPPGGGGEWGWGVGPMPPDRPEPFPIPDDPGSPPNGSSNTRSRINLKVECGGEPKKVAFFVIPAGGTGVHFVGVEFELTCTKC